jgi:hypothetical protein
MKKIFKKILELIKFGLMLWGAFTALYVIIVIVYNATNKPTPPPGGWHPPQPGDENYDTPKR